MNSACLTKNFLFLSFYPLPPPRLKLPLRLSSCWFWLKSWHLSQARKLWQNLLEGWRAPRKAPFTLGQQGALFLQRNPALSARKALLQ